jgi:Domain of unknown function (DUF3471)
LPLNCGLSESGEPGKSAPQTEPSTSGDLQHWQYETFKAHRRDRTIEDAFVTFSLNPDGSIKQARLAAVSPRADFSFDYQESLLKPAEKKP